MQAWSLASTHKPGARMALAGIIDTIGRPQFATAVLAELSPVLGIGSWAAYTTSPPSARDCRALLRERCPALTQRELDVLERLLQGMTYVGIAVDLGLSVASVKTYRARAFDRLDIHFRNELFASFIPPAVNLLADRPKRFAATHCGLDS